ncbi:MAG: 3-phosphoshikimate 1-carboxyvinyltransferase [Paludibacteraceae bacterium]|nr:3-phosphoshikimate 1-carboxyvinyltransferase [Paludibacteraceae bacterium]
MCNVDNIRFLIGLPLSKSVRARELVLDALAGEKIEIEDDNDDIFVLSRALKQCKEHSMQLDVELDLHHSGTALRFLTAYCAVSEGEFVLRGSQRLCERPMKPLVDALLAMGADISYVDKEGFAPLRIKGKRLRGGRVRLDASVSSQFASALMLITDKVDGGVEIEYDGNVVSQSYIRLTESVIERYERGVYKSRESDWSSATVWYAVMAILKRGEFRFWGLSLESVQPDRVIVDVFEKLGVKTKEIEGGVAIEWSGCKVDKLELNCENMPDAVMYIVVAACLLGVEFEISGVKTLRVKESDRIEALMTEMRKCGYVLKYDEIGKICWLGERCEVENVPHINTYNDHRIAMSMAVVGLMREIEIEDPEVVNKSYPSFWSEFDKIKNIYCDLK